MNSGLAAASASLPTPITVRLAGWQQLQSFFMSPCRFAGPFCARCAAGEICPGGGRLSPVVCPANSFAPVTATTVQQCVCKPGYGRPANSSLGCTTCPICEVCPIGSYSSGGSTDSCVPCGRGRTTTAVGSTGAAACVCAPG
jgi:hypothetical protein